jgi:hypothetical protein
MNDPQIATREALETTWSLEEIAKANALLDMRAAIEKAARPPKGGGT